MSNQDTTQISRYLLGQLPQEEMDRIETRLLSETGLFELAETVEDDVVDRYVRGELSPEERRRFERRLLPSERIRERVELARALAAHDRGRARPDHGATVLPFVRRPAAVRLAWAASLVVFLLAGFLAVQLVGLRGEVGELEEARMAAVDRAEELEAKAEEARLHGEELAELQAELADAREEIAALESREAPVGTAPEEARTERRVRKSGDYETLFLSMIARSADGLESLTLKGKEGARLQIHLGRGRPSEPILATITHAHSGVVVWDESGLDPEVDEGEQMLVLLVPAETFQEAEYRVELRGERSGQLLAYHEFRVKR